jgi:hypothetical protein
LPSDAYAFVLTVEDNASPGPRPVEIALALSCITEGVVKGDDISSVENLNFQGMPLRITYKGKLSGDEIKFTRNVADIADEPFVAKRSK